MTSKAFLALGGGVAMLLVACGGTVSLGQTGQNLGSDGGDAGGGSGKSCAMSDCANSQFACSTGPATNLRCERGPAGGSAGPDGICTLMGDCPAPTDPCAGQTFPTCPRECDKFPETGTCSTGDKCRLQGSTIGDDCECTGGAWQCQPHPPLGMGCNKVCEPAADPCAGVTLKPCQRECTQFPEQGACTPGDSCRAAGSKIGDECTCSAAGTWQCAVHPPLGTGCNLVCK